jgi:PH (Pleckstrin Homology) domain-containing protein
MVEVEEEFATYDHAGVAIPGIGPSLPPGEQLLWAGAPNATRLARHALHARFLVGYFAVLLLSPGVFAASGSRVSAILTAAVWVAPLGVATVLFARTFAALVARTTVYAITDRRVVMKVGIALPTTINIPLRFVTSVDMQSRKDGGGDIALSLAGDARIAYLLLWPHARPWRFSHPQPTLRGIDDVARIGRLVAGAISADGRP